MYEIYSKIIYDKNIKYKKLIDIIEKYKNDKLPNHDNIAQNNKLFIINYLIQKLNKTPNEKLLFFIQKYNDIKYNDIKYNINLINIYIDIIHHIINNKLDKNLYIKYKYGIFNNNDVIEVSDINSNKYKILDINIYDKKYIIEINSIIQECDFENTYIQNSEGHVHDCNCVASLLFNENNENKDHNRCIIISCKFAKIFIKSIKEYIELNVGKKAELFLNIYNINYKYYKGLFENVAKLSENNNKINFVIKKFLHLFKNINFEKCTNNESNNFILFREYFSKKKELSADDLKKFIIGLNDIFKLFKNCKGFKSFGPIFIDNFIPITILSNNKYMNGYITLFNSKNKSFNVEYKDENNIPKTILEVPFNNLYIEKDLSFKKLDIEKKLSTEEKTQLELKPNCIVDNDNYESDILPMAMTIEERINLQKINNIIIKEKIINKDLIEICRYIFTNNKSGINSKILVDKYNYMLQQKIIKVPQEKIQEYYEYINDNILKEYLKSTP